MMVLLFLMSIKEYDNHHCCYKFTRMLVKSELSRYNYWYQATNLSNYFSIDLYILSVSIFRSSLKNIITTFAKKYDPTTRFSVIVHHVDLDIANLMFYFNH